MSNIKRLKSKNLIIFLIILLSTQSLIQKIPEKDQNKDNVSVNNPSEKNLNNLKISKEESNLKKEQNLQKEQNQEKETLKIQKALLKEEKTEPAEAYIIFFLITTLLIGAICREISKKTNIPYTPQLLLIGVLLGSYYKNLGDFSISIEKMLSINPKGILFIFIPTLIFESGFNIEHFILKREILQVLILAIPGVIIGLFITGFSFRELLGYSNEFSWSACLSFSSIICATDPVAVIALLKDIGTPLKFNVLLEGESLLNDGTAMVFFIMFRAIWEGSSGGFFYSVYQFFYLSLGGVFFGVLGFCLIILWIKRIVRDDVLTMNLILVSCYLTFFISEFYLEVSGIISIVTLGVLMGKFGRVNMNPDSEHSIHTVLTFLQYSFETCLFIITGTFIGKEVIGDGLSTITQSDFIKMIVFFFLMTFSRFIMLFMMKSSLNKTGWEISNKDIVILTYGGLRGAIALSLALMVAIDENYSIRFREIVIFYVTSMITLTVILNGLSIKYIIKKMKFIPENLVKEKMKEGIKKQLIIGVYEKKNLILQNKFLKMASWEEIIKISELKKDALQIQKAEKQKKKTKIELKENNFPLISKNESVLETRLRFYQLLKSEIWQTFTDSLCSSNTVSQLNDLIDLCSEDIERPIWIWKCVSSDFLTMESVQKFVKYKNTLILGYFCKKYLVSALLHNYEMLFTLIIGLRKINDTKKSLPINIDYIKLVFAEVHVDLKNCEDYLFHLMELFPDLTKAIQEKQGAKMLLNTKKHLLDTFYQNGSITEEEHYELRRKIEKRIKNLEIDNSNWEIPNIDRLQLICPLFLKLNSNLFQFLKENRIYKEFKSNTNILIKDKIVTGVYVIMKGVVIEDDGINTNTQGMGSVLNFGNIINKNNNSLFTVKTKNKVSTFFIPNQALYHLMNKNKEFQESVYKQACFSLFKKTNLELNLNDQKISQILNKSNFKVYEKDTVIELKEGGYLFCGSLKEFDYRDRSKDFVYNGNCFIFEKNCDYKCLGEVRLMKFNLAIGKQNFDEDFRQSIKLSVGRDSFLTLVNLEKDIDRLYNHIEKKILR